MKVVFSYTTFDYVSSLIYNQGVSLSALLVVIAECIDENKNDK